MYLLVWLDRLNEQDDGEPVQLGFRTSTRLWQSTEQKDGWMNECINEQYDSEPVQLGFQTSTGLWQSTEQGNEWMDKVKNE